MRLILASPRPGIHGLAQRQTDTAGNCERYWSRRTPWARIVSGKCLQDNLRMQEEMNGY